MIKATGVSIVVCGDCGHDHPLGTCEGTIYAPQGDPVDICGCTHYHPVLIPFVNTKPSPKPITTSWEWTAFAWFLLLALIIYGMTDGMAK